jgi:hypothetical protein
MQVAVKGVACAVLTIGAVAASGCSSTKPLSAAGIEYRMPRTDVIATLQLKLVKCAPLELDADLGILAKAGVREGSWYLQGEKLASSRIKRELKLTLGDDRVLMGVNSANADQTPAIVGNVVKVLLAAGAALATPLSCQGDAQAAVARVSVLKKQMLKLRTKLSESAADTPTAQDLKFARELNTLSREYAALQEGLLRVDLSETLVLDDEVKSATPRPVTFKTEQLKKWFGAVDAKEFDTYLGLTWSAKAVTAAPKDALNGKPSWTRRARDCGLSLSVPQTRVVRVDLKSNIPTFVELKAKADLAISQWNDPAQLCLDVGFGESRSVSLAFDKFGQTKELSWATEARAANVAGALAGIAPDAVALRTALQGPSALADQKAEIDELETQQKLNKLRACRAILDAGGFNCDEVKE